MKGKRWCRRQTDGRTDRQMNYEWKLSSVKVPFHHEGRDLNNKGWDKTDIGVHRLYFFTYLLTYGITISVVAAATDVPRGRPVVRLKEASPNMVILEVEPPRDNGGKRVTGYRVEFGRKITDYAVGLSPRVINILTDWFIDRYVGFG